MESDSCIKYSSTDMKFPWRKRAKGSLPWVNVNFPLSEKMLRAALRPGLLARQVTELSNNVSAGIATSAWARKTFEPDYLDSAGPVIPTYPPLNIQMKAYNFDILESFQSYVHNLAENLGVDVESAWATPARTFRSNTYIEGGTRLRDENHLHLYERNVQVVGLRSIDAPILFDIIRTCLPEGVHLSIHEHKTEHYEERWIPDPFLDGIRTELKTDEEKKREESAKARVARDAKEAKKQENLLKTLEEDPS